MRQSARLKAKSKQTTTPPPPLAVQASPFLDLPAEIRDEIYAIVVVSEVSLQPKTNTLLRSTELQEATNESFLLTLPPERTLALARACSQIYDEVIPIYFGKNRFTFPGAYELYTFLYMIGEQRRSHIKDITFQYRGCCQKEAFELLGDCSGLRRLTLGLSNESTKGARMPQQDLWAARGTKYLKMVKGLKKVEVSFTQERKYGFPFKKSHAKEFVRKLQEGMRQEKVVST